MLENIKIRLDLWSQKLGNISNQYVKLNDKSLFRPQAFADFIGEPEVKSDQFSRNRHRMFLTDNWS